MCADPQVGPCLALGVGAEWRGQGSLCWGPRARGFVLLGLRRAGGGGGSGLCALAWGGGALGGLSQVSPLLGHPAVLCVQVPWGYAHVEGLHSMWFSAQAPLWGGSVIVVIILPGKDAGIRAW